MLVLACALCYMYIIASETKARKIPSKQERDPTQPDPTKIYIESQSKFDGRIRADWSQLSLLSIVTF